MATPPRKQKLKIGCILVASAGAISGCGGAVTDDPEGTDDPNDPYEPEGSGGAWIGTGGTAGAVPSGGAFVGDPYVGTGGFLGDVGVPMVVGTGGWGAGGAPTGGNPGVGGSLGEPGTGGLVGTGCIGPLGFPNCPVGVPPLGGAGPDDDLR